jgi:oligopeptidase B
MCRKPFGSTDAPEEVTLDRNQLADGKKFVGQWVYEPSDDGNLLAYSIDFTGFREYTTFIKDLRIGKVLDTITRGRNRAVWAADNRTLFYLAEDDAKRAYQLWRHTLGQNEKDDALIYEEKDRLFELDLDRSDDEQYVVLTSASFTSSEVRLFRADRPMSEPMLLMPRQAEREYYVTPHGTDLYIRVNDTGRNFRLVKVPASDPRPESWKEVIAHRDNVKLEDVDGFAHHVVVTEQGNALPAILVIDLASGERHEVAFPEPVFSVNTDRNEYFNTVTLRLAYQSFVTPKSIYDYDMTTRKLELKKRDPVLGGYDPAKYESQRINATASDGTDIPISLVWRKELRTPGTPQPLLLWGYGSYGFPESVEFSSNRVSLLDRGVIYAIAHIRGGGDMGKTWHDRGRMMNKRNTFTDFIAAAEHLVDQNYTSRDKLVIHGVSAGGLLMGACANLRPDLFKAIVAQVPFVDVINTMLDDTLPLTYPEYQEWGNPNEKAAYDYMLSYSPYDNVKRQVYPDMLVETSLNDSQVMYWEPAKFVAKLRANKTDNNMLLLKSRLEPAGHGGSSGRYDKLHETAFTYTFILRELGIDR